MSGYAERVLVVLGIRLSRDIRKKSDLSVGDPDKVALSSIAAMGAFQHTLAAFVLMIKKEMVAVSLSAPTR